MYAGVKKAYPRVHLNLDMRHRMQYWCTQGYLILTPAYIFYRGSVCSRGRSAREGCLCEGICARWRSLQGRFPRGNVSAGNVSERELLCNEKVFGFDRW